ncbi:MAG: methionine adenosyltransferase [Nanobdellota archaeon]
MNSNRSYIFTSESVTQGHPDKVCDQISDAILDECLRQDPDSRVACEVAIKTNTLVILGEITSKADIDAKQIALDTIRRIGYTGEGDGFDFEHCDVLVNLEKQSGDIAKGVDRDGEIGAGDQGIMFGYAIDETTNFMPLSIELAHKLTKQLARVREDNMISYLRPDGKAQVSVEYENGSPKRLSTVLISTQHAPDIDMKQLEEDMFNYVIEPVVPAKYLDDETELLVNPTGRFVIGGPQGDAGLTGRKIIVDTYGGHGAHGGGAFSGKDATKVDRSATYMARHIAKNIVAAGLAKECLIQLSYAIGVFYPISVHIDTKGTGKVSDELLEKAVRKVFPLTPKGIIEYLGLKRPIFSETACYGHFGHELKSFTWESIARVNDIKKAVEELEE